MYKTSAKLNNLRTKKLLEITDEDIQSTRDECAQVDAENTELHQKNHLALTEASKTIKAIMSTSYLLHKYLDKNLSCPYPTRELSRLDDLIYRIKKAKEEQQEKERDARIQKAEAEELEKAIVWLLARNLTLGTHFTLENAVSIANDIRFEELVAEAQQADEYIYFNGQNCDDCSGWDGISHRCDCGNRRVCWYRDGNFENMRIYGEAW
jgi:hypothetical protein